MTDAVTRVATLTKAGLDTGEPPGRDLTDYAELREIKRTLTTLSMGLGAVLAVLAVVVVAYSLSLLGEGDAIAPIAGFGVGVFIVVTGAVIYYMFRVIAELITIFADTADNTRRTVAALRSLRTELERVRESIGAQNAPDQEPAPDAAPQRGDAPS
jgi:hypothetical protein